MSAPSRRRFFQFNLRGLLVLTTVVAIFFGLWVSKLHRQQQALKELRRHTTRNNWILEPLDMTCGVEGDALVIRPAPKRD